MDKENYAGKFVESSYHKNNDFAINIINQFLIRRGYTIIQKQTEDYGIDIKAIDKNGKIQFFEAEVKSGRSFTTRDSFPFPTVSFLARKKKWKDIGFWYIIVCKETDYALVANSNDIFLDEYLETIDINTQDRKGKDYFYRVPKNICIFFKIK